MDTTHAEALTGMLTVLGILVLLVLPSLIGIAHERRVDHRIRQAEEAREEAGEQAGGQKSSSRSTVPSTATWYADGRRSKKLVSS